MEEHHPEVQGEKKTKRKKTTKKTPTHSRPNLPTVRFDFDCGCDIEVCGWTLAREKDEVPVVSIDTFDGSDSIPYGESGLTTFDTRDPQVLRDFAAYLLKAAEWLEKSKRG